VAFTSDERLIGEAAKNQAAMVSGTLSQKQRVACASVLVLCAFGCVLMLSLCLRSVCPSFVQNPTNTVFDAKRLIGRNFSDKTVQDDMKLWPFKIVNENTKPIIEVEYQGKAKRFKPEEISAMVLTKMKEVRSASA
jgi:molecular chaperone DnaK (HSP70)